LVAGHPSWRTAIYIGIDAIQNHGNCVYLASGSQLLRSNSLISSSHNAIFFARAPPIVKSWNDQGRACQLIDTQERVVCRQAWFSTRRQTSLVVPQRCSARCDCGDCTTSVQSSAFSRFHRLTRHAQVRHSRAARLFFVLAGNGMRWRALPSIAGLGVLGIGIVRSRKHRRRRRLRHSRHDHLGEPIPVFIVVFAAMRFEASGNRTNRRRIVAAFIRLSRSWHLGDGERKDDLSARGDRRPPIVLSAIAIAFTTSGASS